MAELQLVSTWAVVAAEACLGPWEQGQGLAAAEHSFALAEGAVIVKPEAAAVEVAFAVVVAVVLPGAERKSMGNGEAKQV